MAELPFKNVFESYILYIYIYIIYIRSHNAVRGIKPKTYYLHVLLRHIVYTCFFF